MAEIKQVEKDIVFYIKRYDPNKDAKPYWKEYTIHVRPGMTILEGLHFIKENLDPHLAFRFSCRMGVCGSCAMMINGKPMLACNAQIQKISQSKIALAPLPNFDIIRDLVPDLVPMIEKHVKVHPYIIRQDDPALKEFSGEYKQTPEQLVDYLQFSYCIKCGACMAACPTLAAGSGFLGPQPLAQSYRYSKDSRDEGYEERKKVLIEEGGPFHCHFAGECAKVCPKGVDPAKAIQFLKRQLFMDYFKFFKIHKKVELLDEPVSGSRLEGVPEAPPYTIPQTGDK